MGTSLQSVKGNFQTPAEQYKYLVVTRLRFRKMVSVLNVVWRGEGGERGEGRGEGGGEWERKEWEKKKEEGEEEEEKMRRRERRIGKRCKQGG